MHRRFASLILTQPEYKQSLLKDLFEDIVNRKDDTTLSNTSSDLLSSLIQAQEEVEQLRSQKVLK